MMRIGLFIVVTLVIGTTGAEPIAAQAPNATLTRLNLAGAAKRYCSGIWVSQRERADALRGSVLRSADEIAAHERGALRFDVPGHGTSGIRAA
jgi:hypothetical protein